ncbi:MAG: Uma2 family endonuclease [Caldilineaceae bacterium]
MTTPTITPLLAEIDTEIEYPESDGQPMGETGIHILAVVHLLSALRFFFRQAKDIYVIGNMFLYYRKDNSRLYKIPDIMVIKGIDASYERRTFKIWEEKAAPNVIFEITSKSTWLEDSFGKASLYASLGVKEYFVFDPLHEYLDEQLVGFALEDEAYTPIAANADGSLTSHELGLRLRADGALLRAIDPMTEQLVPGLDEAMNLAAQETQRAEQEAQRASAAEAEIERLRKALQEAQKKNNAA